MVASSSWISLIRSGSVRIASRGRFVSLLCNYVVFVMNIFDAFGVFSQVVLQCTAIERHDLHKFMAATIVLIESFSLAKCLGIDFGIYEHQDAEGEFTPEGVQTCRKFIDFVL